MVGSSIACEFGIAASAEPQLADLDPQGRQAVLAAARASAAPGETPTITTDLL
jgi:hypothetical protein